MKKQNKVISKVSKAMVVGTIVFSSLGTIPFNTLAADVTTTQAVNGQVSIQNGVKAEYTQIIKTNPWQGNLVGTEYVAKTFSEDFGTNEPFPGVGKTNYSVTKTAFVVIPVSGEYSFRTQGDDRTSVKINGEQKLSTSAYNGTDDKKIGHFHGGDIVEVSQTMENDGSIGFMALKWGMPNLTVENPDGQRKDIPLSSTFPTREQAEQASAKMKDHGVLTEYFDGTSSDVFKGKEIEPESFTKHYGSTEPYQGLGNTFYTVKKTGYIYISETGNYRFNGGGDDYYSLVIDGKELIKNLKYPNFAETGNIYLEKGATIKIEQTLANEGGEGYSSLRWTTPSQPAYSDVKVTDVYESKEKALASNEGTSFEEASEAVKNLFTNKDTNGNIKSTLTQADIDAAQALINKVTDPTKKAELQADLNKAQAQLDAKAAQTEAENKAREAVNNLFTNKDPNGNITGTLTQANIDAAQALVNKVTDPTKKAELQADLNKAQAQLDAKTVQTEAENKAREAVNNLFTNKDPNGNITGTLTQANIDAAQALVNKVTDPAKKATLQADLNKAQAQLDAKTAQTEAENKAREAVNNLFTNKDPNGNITGTLTQANIDAAQALVNKVTDPTKKAELQRDLDRAQELLDARNAVIAAEKARQEVALKAVNELFNNDKPSTDMIKDTTTQATIDAAQKLINAVTDSAVKAGLQKDLDRAQALLNDRLSTVGTITPADFLIGGDKYVTGTFTGSVAKISLLVNDKEYTGGAVKADGTFTFYANDKNIKKTDAVFAVAYDKNGKELERTKVTFVIVTAGKITPATYNLASDRNITGTYTEDVTKVTVTVDGKVYKGGTVANGAFTFYAFDKIKNATDVVTVQAYDQSGKLLDTKTLKIIANVVVTKGSITPNTLTIPSDKNITGTYTDDVNYVVVNVDGTDYKGGTFTAGEFKFYSFDKITSASSNVTIQAYDKAGKLLDTKNLKLVGAEKPNVTSGSIDLNLLTLGTDKSITGTYTGDVKSVEVTVNGTAYKGGTFVEGEFKFYSFDKIKSVADNVTIKALDATGKVVDTKVLQIAAK